MALARSLAASNPPISRVELLTAKWTALWVGLITLGAGLLRLVYLTGEGLNADEGFSVFLARTPAADFRHIIWHGEFNMVLYYALLRGWMHLGRSEFFIRLLSVLFATATVPVVYFLGRRLFSRNIALIACVLFAIHPGDWLLSQQVRSYPLAILLAALSSLFFLRLLENPAGMNIAAYALLSAAAVYSHFFAALVLAAQWLSLAFGRDARIPWKALLRSLLALALLLAPLGIFLLHARGEGQVDWVTPLSGSQVLSVLYLFTFSKDRSLMYVALWIVGVWAAWRLPRKSEQWPYWFVMGWLFLPPIIAIVASIVKPILMARFLAVCIPAAVLLAAAGLWQLARRSNLTAAIIAMFVLIYSASAIRFRGEQLRYVENWRGATALLISEVKPGDLVVMSPYRRHTFDYYRDRDGMPAPIYSSADSLSDALPNPAPQHLWYMASVRFNPYWKGDRPGAAEQQARDFLASHHNIYCEVSLDARFAPVDIWRFTRCPQTK